MWQNYIDFVSISNNINLCHSRWHIHAPSLPNRNAEFRLQTTFIASKLFNLAHIFQTQQQLAKSLVVFHHTIS